MTTEAVNLRSRLRHALTGRLGRRDITIVVICALLSAGLIFGLLYDVADSALRRWTERDMSRRAHLIGAAIAAQRYDLSPETLQRSLDTLSSAGDVEGLIACTAGGSSLAISRLGAEADCRSGLVRQALLAGGKPVRGTIGSRNVAVTAHPLRDGVTVAIVQDRTFLDARRRQVLQVLGVAAEVVVLVLLLLAHAGLRIGSRRTEEAARLAVRRMRTSPGDIPVPTELRLLVRDVHDTVEELRKAPRDGAERLRSMVAASIPDGDLVVLANREPYSHELGEDGKVVVQQPASGLVTAIEPILRSCGGTWIAHGSGSADRLHADSAGRVAVPPVAPEYTLRRLWFEEAEYERYYSGFANEALWPLCHTAYAQPAFRSADWIAYQSVNEKFARAAIEESPEGMLLIQDYHFALVPRMIRSQAPKAVTSLFWHIPWPNAEVIAICPWKEAVLDGLTGADIVGFHTQQYCLNFIESVQRHLECRVDLQEMSITRGGHRTLVRPYPISVEWPYPVAPASEGAALRRSYGIRRSAHVSVGVDRADYTKGLLERMAAIELLLEENPSLAGKYVHVQLASPTRTRIPKYQQLTAELTETVERVNARFGTETWKPVILQLRTFSPAEVRSHYAMADSALVTPLHDGMNLVAKEYVAARQDCDGALVLSVFAGAARELDGALLVNPYDTQQVAQAILRAVRMPLAERRARMESMREQIASSSIFDWSEKLIADMCAVRQRMNRFWPQRLRDTGDPAREVIAG